MGFSRKDRTEPVQAHLREVLYHRLLREALDRAGVPLRECHREDRGDGAIVVAPAGVSMIPVAGEFIEALAASLRCHNDASDARCRMRLRVALHTGELHRDGYGLIGGPVIHVCRLLDAPPLKEAVAAPDALLAVIASDRLYDEVIRQNWDHTNPDRYMRVTIHVKETVTQAWIQRIPSSPPAVRGVRPGAVGRSAADEPALTLSTPSISRDRPYRKRRPA